MQYSNFIMKNNVHATLSTAISSVATTIQLTAWQWSRFWTTFPQIATIESFDENWKVMKREIVKITARNGDNLTVVRAFAPCPENDDANSQSQSAISFNPDDQISLYIPKEIFDKISQSMNDIYDNGTNNMRTDVVSWLQVEVNPWSVLVWSAYYDFAGWTITLTDNATNYLEVDEDGKLANNTTGRNEQNAKLAIIMTANGSVTKIKDRRLWTVWWKIGWVDIHDLTEKQTLSLDDEFIVADNEAIFQNKKITAKTISDTIWVNNILNIDFVLVWWWWGGWNAGNRSQSGWWWGGWWQVIQDKLSLVRWWIYKYTIWQWGAYWWWNWKSSIFWSYIAWFWWGWGYSNETAQSDWNSWRNWWWAWKNKSWGVWYIYWLVVWYNGWNGSSQTWGGGWGAWWNGGNWWWQWVAWVWWVWITSSITGVNIEYWRWWNSGAFNSWIWQDWVNYWDWWYGWGCSAGGTGSRWWNWKNWVLIISYPETDQFIVSWATRSFVAWWNQIHIFETSWTLVVN